MKRGRVPEEADAAQFLVDHLAPGVHRLDPDTFEERVPDALNEDPAISAPFCVYEYRCVVCDEVLFMWDSN